MRSPLSPVARSDRNARPFHSAEALPIQAFLAPPSPALVDRLPEPVLLVDVAGTLVFANCEARRVFGDEDDGLIGVAVEALIARDAGAGGKLRDRTHPKSETIHVPGNASAPIYGL